MRLVTQSRPTLSDPMDCALQALPSKEFCKNTGVALRGCWSYATHCVFRSNLSYLINSQAYCMASFQVWLIAPLKCMSMYSQ